VTLQVSDEAEQETGLPDGVGLPPNGGAFQVHLDNFDGPFDLLLQLISRHKMDITEVALSQVTDEFIAHIKAAGSAWDLDQTSQFVLVAATLLDLKAARLIPSGEVEDPEDLALLEARDLLFARLLQYRAFQRVASYFAATLETEGRRFPLDQRGPIGGSRGKGDGAKAGERVVAGPHACAGSQCSRAGCCGGRSAAAAARDDLPGADQRLADYVDHRGAIPCTAGAVPRWCCGVRAVDAVGGVDGPLDRRG
jgi:hypothetical protein